MSRPGWLRMIDLWCHYRVPRLTVLTGWFTAIFARLYRQFPAVRRHGYLTACVGVKPDIETPTNLDFAG